MDLIATRSMTYATRRLRPGDDFVAKTPRDARVLIAIGKARPAPQRDELAELRARYQEVVGKRPYHGWDAEELQRRIKEAYAAE
jgi:hypothetical protein